MVLLGMIGVIESIKIRWVHLQRVTPPPIAIRSLVYPSKSLVSLRNSATVRIFVYRGETVHFTSSHRGTRCCFRRRRLWLRFRLRLG